MGIARYLVRSVRGLDDGKIKKIVPIRYDKNQSSRGVTPGRTLHPAALAFVPYGVVLVRVRVRTPAARLRGLSVRACAVAVLLHVCLSACFGARQSFISD